MNVKPLILITGAKGQLGSELRELIPLYPQYQFLLTDVDTLDLLNRDAIKLFLKKNRVDYIINCAAYTAVDKAEDDIFDCYRINTDAVQYMIRELWDDVKFFNRKVRIISFSTDYVFDGTVQRPLLETDKPNPPSVYGRSKLDAEKNLMRALPNNSIVIRTSWLYSSYGKNFVKTMIRMGKEKDSIRVVNDQTGTPTYAADLAKVVLQMIEISENTDNFQAGIYHYSNEGMCSWYDFCLKIHELSGITTCKVHPVSTAEYPTRALRPLYSVLDKTKIKETFHIEIPQWEESLERCLEKLKGEPTTPLREFIEEQNKKRGLDV